jgi:hypothetical protein
MQKFKDVTINGREYRVGLVTALVGNWIIESGFQHAKDPAIYERVQSHLFSACSVYREKDGAKVPMKLFAEGRWLVPDLDIEYDLDTVQQLFKAAFDFNFDPFFAKLAAAREAARLAAASDTSQ